MLTNNSRKECLLVNVMLKQQRESETRVSRGDLHVNVSLSDLCNAYVRAHLRRVATVDNLPLDLYGGRIHIGKKSNVRCGSTI